MAIDNKFKVGDLVLFPEDNGCYENDDYGIVTDVAIIGGEGADLKRYYHIYWAIEQESTIEEDSWAEHNIELVAEAS
tara:strand:+ start:164 stop:394 length:231 start_codon:yes stop_codon:yes gene_type:complete